MVAVEDEASGGASSRPDIAGYDVLDHLGRGATGEVWVVRDREGVRFAAKVVSAGSTELDVEASLLQAIDHEHVIKVHQVVPLSDDRTALVMDLAEGGSIADALVERGHFSDGELVTVLSPVARALHDLHGMGLVHADLSPGNILLTGAGKPLIADFGVSRLAGHAGDETWATEAWAAPEVLQGQAPTPASDSYSLGAIAWACVVGRPPEPAALRPDLAELAPWSSAQTRDLVLACLSHTPQARPSVGEFATMLWQCAHAEPAPVKGSAGRRLGVEGDPALTRRIDKAPVEPFTILGADEPDGVRWWQEPALRKAALCTLAVASVVSLLAWFLPFHRGGSQVVGHGRLAPTQSVPVSPSSRVQPAAAKASPAPSGHALTDASGVVTTLLQARASAWRDGTTTRLTSYVLPGSGAESKERAALRAISSSKLRYEGLGFTVRSVSPRPGTGDRQVRAVIDQSAYGVRGSSGSVESHPARPGQTIDFTIRWTTGGWRLVDWSLVT